MPGDASLISKNDFIRWRNPLTTRGIALHEFDRWGSSGLQVHECGYLPRGCRWKFDGVCSPFWRLYYNTRPGSYIEVGKRTIPLLPNRILLVPENVLFNCRGGMGVPHLWIHFSFPATLRPVLTQMLPPVHPAIRGNIALVRDWFRARRRDAGTADKRTLYHATLALLHSSLAFSPLRFEESLPATLNAILEYIDSSLATSLSNTVLAHKAGMSREGFLRWFRAHEGTTPARYVARRRIREACRLLTLTNSSIEEIAEAVGFANRHHFTRVFSQYTGEGPSHFRRSQSVDVA